jgi:hypothetical protein
MEQYKKKLEQTGLAKGTQYIYENEIKKYIAKTNDDTLERFKDEDKIMDYIETNYETFNQKNQMTKAVINFRKLNDKSSDLLSEYLSNNVLKYSATLQEKNKKPSNDILPDIEEYKKFVEDLYEKKEWVKYAINRLITLFQVRNLDLNLTITTDEKEVDDKTNWLLLKDDGITFIRNDYKTKGKYGTKINKTDDKKLVDSIKKILSSGENKLLKSSNISREVLNATNKLGEAKIFKMLVKNATLKEAKIYEQNRGTDLQTISGFYDLA